MNFLWWLRRFDISTKILLEHLQMYCRKYSVVMHLFMVWQLACYWPPEPAVNTAQFIQVCNSLPTSLSSSEAGSIVQEACYTGHSLASLLPSERRYRSLKALMSRLKNRLFSFTPPSQSSYSILILLTLTYVVILLSYIHIFCNAWILQCKLTPYCCLYCMYH